MNHARHAGENTPTRMTKNDNCSKKRLTMVEMLENHKNG